MASSLERCPNEILQDIFDLLLFDGRIWLPYTAPPHPIAYERWTYGIANF